MGYNGTVLAYGQTGSGKTHTMGSGEALPEDPAATGETRPTPGPTCSVSFETNVVDVFPQVRSLARSLSSLPGSRLGAAKPTSFSKPHSSKSTTKRSGISSTSVALAVVLRSR